MRNRIKELRKSLGLNQTEFAKRLGIAPNTISSYEGGTIVPSNSVVLNIVREFGCSETWLRTGDGEMFRPLSREAELGRLIRTRMVNRPDSFQAELVRTLLRFDPDGPEMKVLEKILDDLIAETKKDPEP